MEYSFDIFNKTPERLAKSLAENCRKRGSGREEPLVFSVDYGKARIFHCMLGHAGETLENNPAMQCAGFQTLILRAAEWCATGKVKQKVPADFPTAEKTSFRMDYRQKR